MFAVILLAGNALGLESLANVFSELVSYIPSVIAAIVIMIVGIVLGGFVGGLIMASAGGLHGGPALARVGRIGVIVLAVFMALQELGIATTIVTTALRSSSAPSRWPSRYPSARNRDLRRRFDRVSGMIGIARAGHDRARVRQA